MQRQGSRKKYKTFIQGEKIYLWEKVQRWGEGDDEKLIDIKKGNAKSPHQVNQASCNLLIFQRLRPSP